MVQIHVAPLMFKFLILSSILTGCITSDRVALVASTLSLACDGVQTVYGARNNWDNGKDVEENPLIRGKSPLYVSGYFVGTMVANVMAWYILPTKWRSIYGFGMTAVEINAAGTSDNKYFCR